jgi:hypothetical protein
MKKAKGICLAIAVSVFFTLGVFGADAGSESDPVVTKSYLDSRLNGISGITDEQKKEITDSIIKELTPVIQTATGSSNSSSESRSQYQPVFVEKGKIIYGSEGTELILRSGKGQIYIKGVDGIVNATTGQNMKSGNAVMNNVMIVPRDDGRGIKVTEDAWFLVRGDYEIK